MFAHSEPSAKTRQVKGLKASATKTQRQSFRGADILSTISIPKYTMSRFFHAGDSSSESSSSDEEELYSGEEAEAKSEAESSEDEEASDDEDSSSSSDEGGKTGANRFMRDAVEESEDEDEKKGSVVKSAKDKRLEELEGTIRLIENAEKINDWAVISTGKWHTSLCFWFEEAFAEQGHLQYRVRQVKPASREDPARDYAEDVR